MTNLAAFFVASVFTLIAVGAFYFLIKKWSNFHLFIFGKALKFSYAVFLVWVFVLSFFAVINSFKEYWENDRARVINEFQGVELRWSEDELLFRKGKPDYRLAKANRPEQILIYDNLRVELLNNRVSRIRHDCDSDGYSDHYIDLKGVSCYEFVDGLIKKYGEPEITSVSKDKLSRIYNYPAYNVAFGLSKSKIEALVVFDPAHAPKGLDFINLKSQEGSGLDFSDRGELVEDLEAQGNITGYDYAEDLLGADTPLIIDPFKLDHCSPDLSKAERLERLGLKGELRQTRENSYQAGQYSLSFYSDGGLLFCR